MTNDSKCEHEWQFVKVYDGGECSPVIMLVCNKCWNHKTVISNPPLRMKTPKPKYKIGDAVVILYGSNNSQMEQLRVRGARLYPNGTEWTYDLQGRTTFESEILYKL